MTNDSLTAGIARRTLGPVSDLERHLPAEWWRTLFNAVYLKTDGDIVENDANTVNDIDRVLGAIDLEPDGKILDLCCGQGRHSIELARRGFTDVTGLDRSRYLIRLARRRAKDEGLHIAFKEGDARKFGLAGNRFDALLIMGNSFGYFDQEEDDLAVLTAVKQALKPSGSLVIDITDGAWMRDHFEPRSWEWIDENQFVCRERSLSADGDRLISREVVVHAERGVIADQFYAERLYSRDRIRDLLEQAGFLNIRFRDGVSAESDRGTDLGMMAHRFLILAQAPVHMFRSSARGADGVCEVTVLLGDPSLPDPIKRNSVFNPEDMQTIQRFKAAADTLKGYRFRYLDNHANLMKELRNDPPSFVLNLCDEGFNNDPTKELHVPAFLEMLGIPYSGAGPVALGLCYDKSYVSALAAANDIPTPLETYFDPDDQAATMPSVFPALIKPCTGDSSIGITQEAVVHDVAEAVTYLSQLHQSLPGRAVLVQEFLPGAEYSVGLIGNPDIDMTALPILEVDYSALDPSLPRILGYESKWHPESPYWSNVCYREAELEENLHRNLIDWSTIMFRKLGCRDYARFDFRTDASGSVKLLEVNPNPGWCWDGKLNLMAEFCGMPYAELIRLILEAAQLRYRAIAIPLSASTRFPAVA